MIEARRRVTVFHVTKQQFTIPIKIKKNAFNLIYLSLKYDGNGVDMA
jgi:hypothetical protein